MEQLDRLVRRALFILALALVALALGEKVANLTGFRLSFLAGLTPSRLLELGAVVAVFVMALELRSIRELLGRTKG